MKTKFEGKYSDIIAIDLGTTNCVASVLDKDGNSHNIKDEFGKEIIPSFIYFYDDEESNKVKYTIGNKAKDKMSELPEDVISSYKTYMGIKDEKTGKPPVIKTIKGKQLTAEMCSALMLSYLKELAEKFTGNKITKAVITVPAYFSEAQKSATMTSAKIAGLEVMKLINEPTSAAYYYNKELNKSIDDEKKIVLAYDLGGGTFDLSLLVLEKSLDGKHTNSNVIDVSGDTKLGGDNIDKALASFMYGESVDKLSKDEAEKIIREAEDAKKFLSTEYYKNKGANLYKPKNKELKNVSMKDFLGIIKPFIDRTIKLTKEIVSLNDLKDEIDEILLIGGSTRLPLIREGLIEYFDKFDMKYFDDYIVAPDYAVAYGARVVMKNIIDEEKVEVNDVIPIPIKINALEGLKTMLDKGHPIPTSIRQTFYNTDDNQTVINVDIFEGFSDNIADNVLLGSIEIPITASPKGTVPIMTKISVNKDSVLDIEVKVKGTREKLKVKRHFDGNIERISDLLEDMTSLNVDAKKIKSLRFDI